MSLLPFGSTTLVGLHEGHYDNAIDLIRPDGWFVATYKTGHNPDDPWAPDLSRYTVNQTLGAIVRINNGYNPDGTFPDPSLYKAFAQRVKNFVNGSRGCKRWIIGNEPNLAGERPFGRPISPLNAAECYLLCRDRIKSIPGHENDIVMPPPVATWNPETGWFIDYMREMFLRIGWWNVDGICLHTYTHGRERERIRSDAKANGVFWEFRVFEDMLRLVPDAYRHLPVYITETNPGAGTVHQWPNYDNGWITDAYEYIKEWNDNKNQQIRALVLYRWPKFDEWAIEGNNEIIRAIKKLDHNRYRWHEAESPKVCTTTERRKDMLSRLAIAQEDLYNAKTELDALRAMIGGME